jgi:DNA processing protein
VASGGVVTGEHAPGILPSKGTFPRRNRIISVLTRGTVVVEAPSRSGALITARHALEQGRAVLAVPGRPDPPASAGCLALLRETPARPLTGLEEMLHDLGLDDPAPRRPARRSMTLGLGEALAQLGPVERAIATRLATGPATNDALSAATGLAPSVVAGALTLLQVRGWTHPIGAVHLPAGPLLSGPLAIVGGVR